ncbi:MAG: site-specific integrase [Oscillospiraceae bacterium]|jgi:integrase|nr:site-specific integrase [Oscillospiraceae bacterium]
MAQITKRTNKSGREAFQIRVSDGYNADGRQRRKSMTWLPPAGMRGRRAEKEAKKEAMRFEDALRAGTVHDGSLKFQSFADKWLAEYAEPQLKLKTCDGYKKQLKRINCAIGHIRLRELKTGHLNSFYVALQEDGLNCHTGGKLAASTVRVYHRCISSILSKAVKWGYIPFNPAANAELPKAETKEAPHLDEWEARRLLELLHNEPISFRAMISFDLLSGLRRGELLGLRWCDVDFDTETIRIVQASSYASGYGVYADTPKNKTSRRPLKLSHSAFLILTEYRVWQDEQHEKYGENWKDCDGRVFTGDDGAPIQPDSLTKRFSVFAERSGLPKIHLHTLRHTYASLMIASGTPLVVVSKRLGHAQVSTTANIYAHVIASADEKAAQITEMFADEIAGRTIGK